MSSLLLSLLLLLDPAAPVRGEPGLLAKHAPALVVAAPGLSGSGVGVGGGGEQKAAGALLATPRARRSLASTGTYGTIFGRKVGQTMQIFAYSSDTATNGAYGTLIDADTALSWQTVELEFANGVIESVAPENGIAAIVNANNKEVGVGDMGGSGDTYPAGLVMTVTFTPGTDMDSVYIDFSSSKTAIGISAQTTVSFTSTPRVATVVQDKSNNLYLFASPNTPTDGKASTIEIAVTGAFAESDITALLTGLTPQVGSGFFGLGFLDGSSHLPDGEAIAVASRPLLDIDVDSVKTAVVASPAAPGFDALIFVIGAAFDPCVSCNAIVRKTGNTPRSYGNPCLPGDPTKTYKDGPKSTPDLAQETTECYTNIADDPTNPAAAGSLSSLPAEIEESMLPMFNSQRQTGTGTGGQHPVGVQTSFDSSHFLAPARPAVVAIPVQQGVWASTSGGTGLAGVAPTPACFAAPAASTAVGAPAHAPRAPWVDAFLSLGMLAAESEATACEPWPRGEGETVGAGEASAPEAMEEGVEVAGDKAEEAAPRDEVMAEAGEEDEATEDEASPVAPRRVPCKAAGVVVGEWGDPPAAGCSPGSSDPCSSHRKLRSTESTEGPPVSGESGI
ncbi:hypothetical protein EMIHUDRAFT_95349 [Emiliania huxleyi CCMP1516]|uniref:DOMON domain-containing protein n=2 Tax=Emiliania huxleyi TaxID=2903 RepID=A0A0D3JGR3_EMIH1|nr:hypothetical protein EMIHUDRAFT_95349 [Emiliania huxleyi CCMP1516]EOD22698.1 hypothetical protein EMIHUDRAFT_95349 [Emiliania huxleyi CCMP1516]|eukprot:XP_005775127.1 hypothetical protein EMIHUDRAFT_95349 [Emiliania huxleyi CCMP1516]